MNDRVVVDPITRIEGHLRIEAQMDGDRIAEAYSSGTMVRGIEIILRDRDPRDAWAFAQRICGVCTLVHGIASVRAVEDALNYEIPKNAQLIRNLMIGAQYVHDHVMHFYHLHALDWVDVVSALSADPGATADLAQKVSPQWPKSSPGYFKDVRDRVKGFVESGQLGIFANGYWGHPAYKLPPEANLMAVAHYLEALEWQRDVVESCTRSSAARTRTRTSSWAGCRARSTPIPIRRADDGATSARVQPGDYDKMREPSLIRPTCPTRSPSPQFLQGLGRRWAKAWATSCATAISRTTGKSTGMPRPRSWCRAA